MEATLEGFETGTATLVIQIEKDTVALPKFKEALYEATYNKDGRGNISLKSLAIENVLDESKVVITTVGKYLIQIGIFSYIFF